MSRDDWRPIEFAPRDGTQVLLYNSVTGPYLSKWSGHRRTWPMYGWCGTEGVWYPWPSHWMPLPPPPELP